jgi:hypothetical protein
LNATDIEELVAAAQTGRGTRALPLDDFREFVEVAKGQQFVIDTVETFEGNDGYVRLRPDLSLFGQHEEREALIWEQKVYESFLDVASVLASIAEEGKPAEVWSFKVWLANEE